MEKEIIKMKKSLGPKTYFFPLPVLLIATYDSQGHANVMNAAWGGIHDTNQVALCLSTDHKTTANIILKNEFTISFATSETVKESDYFGLVSGNSCADKIAKAGMHTIKSENVDAPVIDEYPLSLECRCVSVHSDDQGTTFVIADIVNILADEAILDEKGKIDMNKYHPIAYNPSNHTYQEMGKKVGNAFKDGLELK